MCKRNVNRLKSGIVIALDYYVLTVLKIVIEISVAKFVSLLSLSGRAFVIEFCEDVDFIRFFLCKACGGFVRT